MIKRTKKKKGYNTHTSTSFADGELCQLPILLLLKRRIELRGHSLPHATRGTSKKDRKRSGGESI
jgi:hypothetical protein